jgi:two-component system, sensor histidine kinase and response regulator
VSTVLVDALRIQQVLMNLIGNAIKFTERGRVRVEVRDVDSKFVQVEVSDTGIGIAEQDIGRVFEAFQQISNANNRTFEGTGLGVPISNQLVLLHGGALTVKSKLGKGSTFSFTLPITNEKPKSFGLYDGLVPDMGCGENSEFLHTLNRSRPRIQRSKSLENKHNYDLLSPFHDCKVSENEGESENKSNVQMNRNKSRLQKKVQQKQSEASLSNDISTPPPQPQISPQDKCSLNSDALQSAEGHAEPKNKKKGVKHKMKINLTKQIEKQEQVESKTETVSEVENNQSPTIQQQETPSSFRTLRKKLAISKFRDARILIVDDNPLNLRIITRFLEGTPFRILTANSGAEAITMLSEHQISLILMDVMMPDLDGYETTHKIRQTHKKERLPIIFVTAKAEEPEGFLVGGNGYLSKPLKRTALVKVILQHLEATHEGDSLTSN